ncbi:MAG TPA: ATP-binding protein [Phycisphaerales bacterium]|nr:ATP-binding protein [Phycisphaerales bacterium]
MTPAPGHLHNPPDLKLQLFSQARLLSSTRAMVSTISQRLGFNEAQSGQITLAVDEALCNIINHGYDRRTDGQIWMSIWADEGNPPTLKIVLEDLARQVDPKLIRSRKLEEIRPGGLGVFIIHEIMDEVAYEQRAEGGMRLTMVKRLFRDGASDCRSGAPQQQSDSGCHCTEKSRAT